jgi:hypothetical protein
MDEPIVKPKIDDAYWFNYSENLVNQHQQERNEAAGKLQNLILWLWGIYTTFASVGFTLSGKDLSTGTKILIASASAALVGVYWLTVWAQMPICLEFDPRSPTEIKEAYEKSVRSKANRLNITIFASLIASIMVTTALIVASTTVIGIYSVPTFNAVMLPIDSSKTSVAVNAKISEASKVILIVEPVDSKATDVFRYAILPDKEGSIQYSLIINRQIKEGTVSLEWETKDSKKIRLTQKIGGQSSVKPTSTPFSTVKSAIK